MHFKWYHDEHILQHIQGDAFTKQALAHLPHGFRILWAFVFRKSLSLIEANGKMELKHV